MFAPPFLQPHPFADQSGQIDAGAQFIKKLGGESHGPSYPSAPRRRAPIKLFIPVFLVIHGLRTPEQSRLEWVHSGRTSNILANHVDTIKGNRRGHSRRAVPCKDPIRNLGPPWIPGFCFCRLGSDGAAWPLPRIIAPRLNLSIPIICRNGK